MAVRTFDAAKYTDDIGPDGGARDRTTEPIGHHGRTADLGGAGTEAGQTAHRDRQGRRRPATVAPARHQENQQQGHDEVASTSAPQPAASPTACCSTMLPASVLAIDTGYGQIAPASSPTTRESP